MTTDPSELRAMATAAGSIDVLRELDETQRMALCTKAIPRNFADGEELIREGDTTDFILLLLHGQVEIQWPSRVDAAPLRLAAPLMCGEIAAYAGRPRTATVRACGPVDALRLERNDFLDAIRKSVTAGMALTALIADRICAPGSIKSIGPYTVEGLAGKGGSGCVFFARDEVRGERIALKMLSHALALMPGAATAFFREAEMLGRLDHPGIIRVLDAFTGYDTCFIAMPWIEGKSLRRRIDEREVFTADDVTAWTRELLEALEMLHQHGMAHCDIKPSNILIDASRRAMLIDLGAGCFLGDKTGETSSFAGSPLYASPEQIMGRAPDGRSDIYALCCTLYEVVFGYPPFAGETMEDIMHAHLRATPAFDPSRRNIAMSDGWINWLKRGLKRGRNGRPDATDSLAELDRSGG